MQYYSWTLCYNIHLLIGETRSNISWIIEECHKLGEFNKSVVWLHLLCFEALSAWFSVSAYISVYKCSLYEHAHTCLSHTLKHPSNTLKRLICAKFSSRNNFVKFLQYSSVDVKFYSTKNSFLIDAHYTCNTKYNEFVDEILSKLIWKVIFEDW